jgi:methionyl-tRNA formyltransferase
MSVVRVCFLGTPEFAATHLEKLLKDEHYQVVGVISQPDRPSGRHLKLTPSPVKKVAQQNSLEVITPEKLSTDLTALEAIHKWKAEIAIVVAFGQILKQNVLDLFPLGAVNVHGSLLPQWRGAAPIQRSLEAGDSIGGVCLQKMVLKLDAGAVIGERRITLDESINSIELYERLSHLGCELLSIELMDYIKGHLAPLEQDESKVTIAKKISKDESKIDWTKSAKAIHDKIRGFAIGPGTYAHHKNKRVKFHKSFYQTTKTAVDCGEVVSVLADHFLVATGSGLLEVYELQPESKPRMSAEQFAKQVSLKTGDRFE